MTLTLTPSVSDAQTLAAERFDRNREAAGLALAMPLLEPCPGRDGSATATRDGHWLAGCSVPRRASEVMLRNEDRPAKPWRGRSLCLLTPTHGQQIAAVLDRLGPTRALVVIPASLDDLADAFACVDFTDALTAGQLFVATDEAAMSRIFDTHPGLPVPTQMVRLPDADADTVAAALAWAQPALSRHAVDHARRITTAAATPRPATADWVVLGGCQFRTWADSGDTLARVCDDGPSSGVHVLDTDRPAVAAEAFVAERCAAADVVVAADRPRPVWATSPRPWITWLTRPTIPPFQTFARDALLVADDAWLPLARAAGWPADRLAVARWPATCVAHTPGAPLALVADLPDLDPPADVAASSGRQLVWEAIREELTDNPFALAADAGAYVRRAPARLGLPAADDFPVDRFVDAVVGPSVTLGIARWLAGQNVPFTIHGSGWPDDPILAGRARGAVAGRASFHAIVSASGGLIDPFLKPSHPIRSVGVPRVRTFGRSPKDVAGDIASVGRGTASEMLSSLVRAAIERFVR